MQLQLVPQLIPETECIFLLGRVYGNVAGTPNSIANCAAQICRTYDIPSNILLSQVAPLTEVEQHVLQGIHISEEELQFFFYCTNGVLFSNMAWSLFFLEQSHVDFAELSARQQLEELRHVIGNVLDCDAAELSNVSDADELVQVLDQFPCELLSKWICQKFWYRPAAYQQRFREILGSAVQLFQEASPLLNGLLKTHLPELEELTKEPSSLWQPVTMSPARGDISLYPSAMWFNGIGSVADKSLPGGPVQQLQVGVLYRTLQKLVSKYKNRNDLLVDAAWALGDTRRMEILTALHTRSLCNQELSEMLSLSAATVSHHMAYLIQNGFVITRKNGNRLDYALDSEGIKSFIEMVQASLL